MPPGAHRWRSTESSRRGACESWSAHRRAAKVSKRFWNPDATTLTEVNCGNSTCMVLPDITITLGECNQNKSGFPHMLNQHTLLAANKSRVCLDSAGGQKRARRPLHSCNPPHLAADELQRCLDGDAHLVGAVQPRALLQVKGRLQLLPAGGAAGACERLGRALQLRQQRIGAGAAREGGEVGDKVMGRRWERRVARRSQVACTSLPVPRSLRKRGKGICNTSCTAHASPAA